VLTAAVVRELISAGLSGEPLIEALTRIEAESPFAAVLKRIERKITPDLFGEVKPKKAKRTLLPEDWKPGPEHYQLATTLGQPERFVATCFSAMRFWARSNAILKADWSATLAGFMTRDAKGRPGAARQANVQQFSADPRL
jgi:hypothetical protein